MTRFYHASAILGSILLCFSGCATSKDCEAPLSSKQAEKHFNWVMKEVRDPQSKNVLVVAHRGDWRNAPENSLLGLKNAIAMGVDIVEIDLKKTKDGQLVLMHDKNIDRTTTGKGSVSDYTLDSLETFFLRKGNGIKTGHKIPTFKEYMQAAKGKMFINIDKGYPFLKEAYIILQETGTLDQVFINSEKTLPVNFKDYGDLIRKVSFKPVVSLDKVSAPAIDAYLSELHPPAIEFVFANDTSKYIQHPELVSKYNTKIWYNSLWPSMSANHSDDIAYENGRPADGWGWMIAHGATLIQTDRPKELLKYLVQEKRHPKF